MMRGVRHWAVAVRKPLHPDTDKRGKGESHDGKPANLHDVSHSLEVAFEREGQLGREEEEGKLEELGEIEVVTFPLTSALARHRWLRLPILRGIVALGGSLAIGFRALGISANAQLPEGEADEDHRKSAPASGSGRWWWRWCSRSDCFSFCRLA